MGKILKAVQHFTTASAEHETDGSLRYILESLLEFKADPNIICGQTSGQRLSALLMASMRGCTFARRWLLDAKANIEERNSENNTPLMLAVRLERFECVKILLDRGADFEAVGPDGSSLELAEKKLLASDEKYGVQDLKKNKTIGKHTLCSLYFKNAAAKRFKLHIKPAMEKNLPSELNALFQNISETINESFNFNIGVQQDLSLNEVHCMGCCMWYFIPGTSYNIACSLMTYCLFFSLFRYWVQTL